MYHGGFDMATQAESLANIFADIRRDPETEERWYIDFGNGEYCRDPDGARLYDMGVLTRFSHVLLRGDEFVDCAGPVVHPSVYRPDLQPQNHVQIRDRLRMPLSPKKYALGMAKQAQHYKFGFLATYPRDTNYQMFVVVCASRWWCASTAHASLHTPAFVLLLTFCLFVGSKVHAEVATGKMAASWWSDC
jgi:hypothetical protein